MAESAGPGHFRELNSDDYYLTEDGYVVFTAKYHLRRGQCCQNGCKHCPYGFDKRSGKISKV